MAEQSTAAARSLASEAEALAEIVARFQTADQRAMQMPSSTQRRAA
jgi:hypothetical protein